jgi:hypothetical protein
MRNTLAFPLTDAEVQSWLDRKLDEFIAVGAIGSMDGVIIRHLKNLAQNNPITTETTTTTASA